MNAYTVDKMYNLPQLTYFQNLSAQINLAKAGIMKIELGLDLIYFLNNDFFSKFYTKKEHLRDQSFIKLEILQAKWEKEFFFSLAKF